MSYIERYLLEPPEEVQIATGISMLSLRHQRNQGKDYDEIGVIEDYYTDPYHPDSEKVQKDSHNARDNRDRKHLMELAMTAYDAIDVHGIATDDDVKIESIDKGEMQTELKEYSQTRRYDQLPASSADELTSQQEEMRGKMADFVTKRQEVEKRKKQDEEGHDFEDGLKKYAVKREEENISGNPFENNLKASLNESAQALMWRRSEKGIVPGALLTEEARSLLLDRLQRGHISQENLDTNPRPHLAAIEQMLTQELLAIDYDPETRKEIIKIPREYYPGRYERDGEMVSPNIQEGYGMRGHSISRTSSGELVIKPDDDTTFTDLTVTLAPPDEEIDADILDRDGNPVLEGGIQKRIKAKPILRARLTETVAGKEDEKTSLYRTREGLVVICPGGTAKCYPDDLSAQANITRKPVIYLYPRKKSKVHVELDYKGQLTNSYPQINGNSWEVIATPDGTLTVNGKQYKYLFWDGINGQVEWDWSEGFCINRKDVDTFLEKKIAQLGLNFAEAQDFITYWAPIIKQNEWSLVSFQTEKYEELAKLLIDPKPDTLIRVFMIFKKSEKQIAIPRQQLEKMKRKGFTVVEWGGSNLDELSLVANSNKTIPHHENRFEIVI